MKAAGVDIVEAWRDGCTMTCKIARRSLVLNEVLLLVLLFRDTDAGSDSNNLLFHSLALVYTSYISVDYQIMFYLKKNSIETRCDSTSRSSEPYGAGHRQTSLDPAGSYIHH